MQDGKYSCIQPQSYNVPLMSLFSLLFLKWFFPFTVLALRKEVAFTQKMPQTKVYSFTYC